MTLGLLRKVDTRTFIERFNHHTGNPSKTEKIKQWLLHQTALSPSASKIRR